LSGHPFPETLERLKRAIQAEDLWLVQELDPQLLAARGGHGILAARQLFFFHPRYLVRILETDPAALLEAPLKLTVLERPDGAVLIRWQEVAARFSGYSGLTDLGLELEALQERLLAAVLG
jgi:uncharacterized protein (DUF302 family)